MGDWNSHVLPHGAVESLAPGIWQVTGKLPHGNMPRNMIVYKLPSGGLLIHSAIALNDTGMRFLESLGQPELMIVPNRMHRLDALVWKERYPALRVIAPAAARKNVESKLPVDATCEETLGASRIVCHAPDGVRPSELAYEMPLADGGKALVVTDILMNMERRGGFDGWLFHALGSTGFFGMTLIGRMLLLQDKAAFKAWLEKMAALPNLKVISVAHGRALMGDCSTPLRAAAARL